MPCTLKIFLYRNTLHQPCVLSFCGSLLILGFFVSKLLTLINIQSIFLLSLRCLYPLQPILLFRFRITTPTLQAQAQARPHILTIQPVNMWQGTTLPQPPALTILTHMRLPATPQNSSQQPSSITNSRQRVPTQNSITTREDIMVKVG